MLKPGRPLLEVGLDLHERRLEPELRAAQDLRHPHRCPRLSAAGLVGYGRERML